MTPASSEPAGGVEKRKGKDKPPAAKPKRQPAKPVDAVPIAELTQDERMAAIRRTFSRVSGIMREDAIKEIALEMGYDRVGNRIYDILDGDVKAASRRRIIARENGLYYPDCRNIADYPRDLLKEVFLSVLGRTWQEQDEVIRRTANYLGFTRTGANIQDEFRSVINGLIRQGEIERDGKELRRV